MKKYFRIYKIFLQNAISHQSQYRANTWMQVILNLVWVFMIFIFIETFFLHTENLGGWQKHEVYLLSLTWILVVEVTFLLFSGLRDLPADINEGNIDLFLAKPADKLFLISTRKVYFISLYQIIFIIPIFIWFFIKNDIFYSWTQSILAVVLVFSALLIQYAVLLFINTLSFWLERFDNINELWLVTHEVGKYPIHVLPKIIQVVFLTFVPIAFTAYVPVATLIGQWRMLYALLAIVFSFVLFFLSLYFWNFAIKRYSSASS